jgi:hypothetical protein
VILLRGSCIFSSERRKHFQLRYKEVDESHKCGSIERRQEEEAELE